MLKVNTFKKCTKISALAKSKIDNYDLKCICAGRENSLPVAQSLVPVYFPLNYLEKEQHMNPVMGV